MSLDAMRWAKKVKTGKSSAKSVLTWLADMCGADHCAFPSIPALAEATELDKKNGAVEPAAFDCYRAD